MAPRTRSTRRSEEDDDALATPSSIKRRRRIPPPPLPPPNVRKRRRPGDPPDPPSPEEIANQTLENIYRDFDNIALQVEHRWRTHNYINSFLDYDLWTPVKNARYLAADAKIQDRECLVVAMHSSTFRNAIETDTDEQWDILFERVTNNKESLRYVKPRIAGVIFVRFLYLHPSYGWKIRREHPRDCVSPNHESEALLTLKSLIQDVCHNEEDSLRETLREYQFAR